MNDMEIKDQVIENENQINADAAEQDFLAGIEASMRRIHTGQTVTGTVVQVTEDEVCVNIGYKSDGLIKRSDLVDQNVNIGDEIEVEVDDDGKPVHNDVKQTYEDIVAGNKFTMDLTMKNISNGEEVVVTRRLAGENSDGENYGMVDVDDGVYTIKGLQLGEGSTQFDLRLEGTQYLKDGVYRIECGGNDSCFKLCKNALADYEDHSR